MYGVIALSRSLRAHGSRRFRHVGGLVPLLLLERRLLGIRQPRGGEPDGLRPLRQGQATADALLSLLQGPVLGAKGDAALRLPADAGAGVVDLRAPRRSQRGPRHRAAGEGEPQHRGPLRPVGRRSRPPAPRRAGGVFPRRPVKPSSTRSGRSSSRSRSTVTPTTRPTRTAATTGTMWRSTPRADWCWPWCPGPATPRPSRGWSMSSNGARIAACSSWGPATSTRRKRRHS